MLWAEAATQLVATAIKALARLREVTRQVSEPRAREVVPIPTVLRPAKKARVVRRRVVAAVPRAAHRGRVETP